MDGVTNLSDCNTTYKLAQWIASNQSTFRSTDVSNIFALNAKNDNSGIDSANDSSSDSKVDIYYYTCLCMFHDQADNNGDGYKVKLTNIIDVNSPDTMTVYKYNTDGSISSNILDFSTEASAKSVYNTMVNTSILSSDISFDYASMKRDITAFAYLAYKSSSKGTGAEASRQYEDYKNAVQYYWKQPGGRISIRKYVKASGLLDNYYYQGQNQNDEVNAGASTQRQEAETVANSILTSPTLTKGTTTPTVQYSGGKAYIGPLKVTYAGGTPSIKVGSTTVNWASSVGGTEQTGTIVSNSNFYAVIDESTVKNSSTVNVIVTLSYTQYTARFVLGTNKANGGQSLMFYSGAESTGNKTQSWTVQNKPTLTLVKKNNGTEVSGVKFEVYEGTTKKGELTSGTSNTIQLDREKTYTLKEVTNNKYGYKGLSISSATISSGGTIVSNSISGSQLKFTLTGNATITVNNTPKLGNLTIEKVDSADTTKKLSGVGFVIWQGSKYLKLTNSSGSAVAKITGTAIINANNVANSSEYKAEYTSTLDEATVFYTNTTGQIVIQNLEVWMNSTTKYEYWVMEKVNNNFGYKGTYIESATVNGTATSIDTNKNGFKFTFDNSSSASVTVVIKNTRKLVSLKLQKEGVNSEKLAGVKFALADNAGYIGISGYSSITSPSNGTPIDIKEYAEASQITHIDSAENATQFVTNSNGELYFANLEQYSAPGTKMVYTLCETGNDIDGYEMMLMSSGDVTWPSSGTSNESVNSTTREISFTIDDTGATVLIKLRNRKQIGQIEIHKTDQSGSKNLAGVEFNLLRGTNEYIQLKYSNGNVVPSVTGAATISSTNYSIGTTTNAGEATTFITDNNGKITIDNVKIYNASGSKYIYGVKEIANNNYGYKNMGMTSSDLSVVSGGTIYGDVDTTNRLMYFTINDNTGDDASVQVQLSRKNTEELFDLKIHKVGSNSENLAGVKFYVLQDDKYIKLSGSNPVTGTVTIDKDNITNIETTTDKSQATVFVTDKDGYITIKNLEVYSAPNDKYTYTVQEIENTNYGYKNMSTSATNFFEVSGGTQKSITASARAITFEPNSNTATITVTRTNTQELFNLTINKASDDGTKLAGVEFKIEIGTGSYLQLQNGGQKVTGTVSIKKYSTQTSGYEVAYVTDKNSATTFVTDSNGQLTINNLEIYSAPGEKYTYTVEEISNSNYGFKNMNTNGTSTTVSGAANVIKDAENNKIEFTPNSKDVDISIGMINIQQLFDLEIYKTGENGQALAGVEFVVLQNGKYLRLTDSSGNNPTQPVEGTVTINKSNIANGGEYHVDFVDDEDSATKFKTNSNGIIINNLEIYSAPGDENKYIYTVRETANSNYGYKNMAVTDINLSVSGGNQISKNAANREISFTANAEKNTVTVDMKNNEELIDLTIHKVGENGKNLAGVKFYVLQDNKYIKLSGDNPVTGTVTINKNNIATGNERSLSVTENESEATVFITDSNGQIIINNLEIYSGVGEENKYSYTVREIENSNYGYKNMAVSQIDSSITGGTVNEIENIANKEVTFTVNNTKSNNVDATVQMKNDEELFDLTIHKESDTGKDLAGVKFHILQDDKYIKLSPNPQNYPVAGGVTINKDNIATGMEWSMSVTSDVNEATIFVTSPTGRIVINNLEIYSEVEEKYEYTVREIDNDNYGYKNMTVSGIGFVDLSGGTVSETKDMENKEVKFTVNNAENNTVDVTLQMKNNEELFNLKIHKTGLKGTGENGSENLAGVKFLILQDNKYVQINGTDGRKETVTGIVTINKDNKATGTECNISFTDDITLATTFITDSNGQVLINNVEIYAGVNDKYTYSVREIHNENYGYKGSLMNESDVSLSGVTMIGQVDTINRQVDFEIDDSSIRSEIQVNISNTPHYGNLEITKVDKNNTDKKLPNVRFKLKIDDKYVQLTKNGKIIKLSEGKSTISKTGEETNTEFGITYVDESQATLFTTSYNGKIVIENLEVYSGIAEDNITPIKYTYAFFEEYNENYGYTKDTSSIEGQEVQLESGTTTTMGDGIVTNEQFLGNLQIQKVDEDYTNIYKMENVQFVLAIVKDGKEQYVVSRNEKGEVIPSLKGNGTESGPEPLIIIDENEIATSNEYYVDSKDDATIFITDAYGRILIENLEVYDKLSGDGEEYTYRLIEIYNPYYGYEEIDPNNPPTYETTLKTDETVLIPISETGMEVEGQIPNDQLRMKISGFVWLEKSDSKSNQYDCVYTEPTEDAESPDKKLTDLYVTDSNGKVTGINTAAEIPVEIKLRDKTTNTFIRQQPDEFNITTGEYTFVEIEIATLGNYEVVFTYDGFYYVTIAENIEDANGSKVKDIVGARNALNNRFESVEAGGIINSGGIQNQQGRVAYDKPEGSRVSTVSAISFDTTIPATTTETGYYLDGRFDALKKSVDSPVEGLKNVNMGLYLREQPKIGINSDIDTALVQLGDYEYTYKYNGRQKYYTNENGDPIGVKFEQETITRYTQTVYASDIELWKKEATKETMNVYIIYKIRLFNQSSTLTSVINEITNYYDADYTIAGMGLGLDANSQITDDISHGAITENVSVTYGDGVTQRADKSYNSVKIPINLRLTAGENKALYIKFKVNEKGKVGLLNGESTFHNATEVMSYSTYYGETTNYATYKDGILKNITTDTTAANEIYAGIDEASQPGNINLKLINFSEEDKTTPVLDSTSYEDDETSAPSLLLVPTEQRKLSGTVWEDASSANENNERAGNGTFDSGENYIDNVTVELHYVNDDGTIGDIAKYSDGTTPITAKTTDGKYEFGYYDATNNKHIGILPDRYVIKYIYTDDSTINGNKIEVSDYKSTIIVSGSAAEGPFKAQDQGQGYSERWYITNENGVRNTDARDDINLRPEYENAAYVSGLTVTNDTYDDYDITSMNAYTPIMDIGIEFTEGDFKELENNATAGVFIKNFENIDFGIVERAHVDVTVKKKITSLEITAQTGASIIPKGDPSDPNARMQYVKTGLPGVVSVEAESRLLQAARLNIEYTITVTNNSERDYAEVQYYYYGTNKNTDITPKVLQVVDYLDASMSLDLSYADQNKEIWGENAKTVSELCSGGTGTKRLINAEVEAALNTANYNALLTKSFEDVGTRNSKQVTLYTYRNLAVTDSIAEANRVEVVEITGTRTIKQRDAVGNVIKEAIPGNYVPAESDPPEEVRPVEPDEDRIDLVVTAPTGITENPVANYTTNPLYIAAVVGTFTILIAGIVIIKKKVIR